MNLKDTFIAVALAANISSTALAEEKNTDSRICMQPFAGQLMKVSCEDIASILDSASNKPLHPLATVDTPDGRQINQINDKDGAPVLFIITPPEKKKVSL